MTEADFDGVPDVPLHVINNYFSIGADAQIALLFHNERGTCTVILVAMGVVLTTLYLFRL